MTTGQYGRYDRAIAGSRRQTWQGPRRSTLSERESWITKLSGTRRQARIGKATYRRNSKQTHIQYDRCVCLAMRTAKQWRTCYISCNTHGS